MLLLQDFKLPSAIVQVLPVLLGLSVACSDGSPHHRRPDVLDVTDGGEYTPRSVDEASLDGGISFPSDAEQDAQQPPDADAATTFPSPPPALPTGPLATFSVTLVPSPDVLPGYGYSGGPNDRPLDLSRLVRKACATGALTSRKLADGFHGNETYGWGLSGDLQKTDPDSLTRSFEFDVPSPELDGYVARVLPSSRAVAQSAGAVVKGNVFSISLPQRGQDPTGCEDLYINGVRLIRYFGISVTAEFEYEADAKNAFEFSDGRDFFECVAPAKTLGIHVIQMGGTSAQAQAVLDRSACALDNAPACRQTLSDLRAIAAQIAVVEPTDLDWETFRPDWGIGSVSMFDMDTIDLAPAPRR